MGGKVVRPCVSCVYQAVVPFHCLTDGIFVLPFPIFLSTVPGPLVSFGCMVRCCRVDLAGFLIFGALRVDTYRFRKKVSRSLKGSFFKSFAVFYRHHPNITNNVKTSEEIRATGHNRTKGIVVRCSRLSTVFTVHFLSPTSSIGRVRRVGKRKVFTTVTLSSYRHFQ